MPPPAGVFPVLRSLSPFKLFADEELREIAPLCEIETFEGGHPIISEGEPSDNKVYFVLSGGVEVSITGKFILALKREGDIFGEMSLISDEPRSATVTVSEPSRILAINSALTFEPGEGHYYKLRYYFSRMFGAILTDKLRLTSERARLYEDAVTHSRETEQKSTTLQEQIRQNLLQLRIYSHLVGSAKDAILIVNTAGVVLEGNPSLEADFGIDAMQFSGKPISPLLRFPPGGPENWAQAAQAASAGGWSGEVEVAWGKSPPVPAECSISLICDTENEALAFSVIMRNISERKAHERKILNQSRDLERANVELREMDKLKDNFIGLISHELRTPLSTIIAFAETLAMEGMVEPEDQGDYIQTIHSEALQLSRLVNKMITISRIESGQMVFEFEEARLDEVLRAAAGEPEKLAQEKNLEISFRLDENGGPTFFDREQIQEAFAQVLTNAVRFTDSGSVEVSLSRGEDETLIRVRDTGKGMEEGEVASAFNRFEIVKDVTYHQTGIGLGLPLAFLIVRAHGGQIALDSAPGKGTTVSVTLPHRPPESSGRS